MSVPPETRYARNGAIHLAYQVLGSGPPNLLVVQSGPNTHVDYVWTEPSLARFMRRLASFSRLIMYDNRGVGLSDPVPSGAAPTMDEQVDDVRAILDETGSQRAVLAGCAPALMFAATHPGRVESLILLGGYARLRGCRLPAGPGSGPHRPGLQWDLEHLGHRGGAHRGRVAALADPGEILVSRTIRDLLAGAPVPLESRGVHQLKGVPGSWEVFAVVSCALGTAPRRQNPWAGHAVCPARTRGEECS